MFATLPILAVGFAIAGQVVKADTPPAIGGSYAPYGCFSSFSGSSTPSAYAGVSACEATCAAGSFPYLSVSYTASDSAEQTCTCYSGTFSNAVTCTAGTDNEIYYLSSSTPATGTTAPAPAATASITAVPACSGGDTCPATPAGSPFTAVGCFASVDLSSATTAPVIETSGDLCLSYCSATPYAGFVAATGDCYCFGAAPVAADAAKVSCSASARKRQAGTISVYENPAVITANNDAVAAASPSGVTGSRRRAIAARSMREAARARMRAGSR